MEGSETIVVLEMGGVVDGMPAAVAHHTRRG
jgi:hypothetical protein